MNHACRKATELISLSMDQRLSLRQRWSLAFHLAVCRGCRQFQRQVRLMRQLVRDAGFEAASPPSATAPELSTEARARIEAALRRQL
jgi:hypothetical protein